MRTPHRIALLLLLCAASVPGSSAAAEHRFGVGLHAWRTLDDLEDEGFSGIEDEGLAGLLSYQYVPPGLFRIELDLEVFPDGFGGTGDTAVSPIAFILFGKGLYAGAGVGVTFSSGFSDDVSDPFFAGRVGFNFLVLPRLHLDVNANFRADAFSELENADTGTITLGAILRFAL